MQQDQRRETASGFRTGELIAAIGGVLLIVVMFLSWLGIPDQVAEAAEGLGVSTADISTNAWESFTFLDIAWLVAAIGALVPAVLAASGAVAGPTRAGLSLISSVLGVLAALSILYRIIDPLKDASLKYGIWLGLITAVVIAYGSWRAVQEARADQVEARG